MSGDRIESVESLIGQTIKAAFVGYGAIGIVLENGSWLYAEAELSCEEVYMDYHASPTTERQLELGIITQEEHDAEKLKSQQRQAKWQDEYERKEFDRLKAKFETK